MTCKVSQNTESDRVINSYTIQPLAVVPVVRVTPSILNVTVGSTATFNCTASGDPTPTLTWSYSNQQLSSGGRILISPSGESLRILNAQQSDEGVYVCEAENQVGSDTAQVSLDVQGKAVLNYVV